MKQVYVSSRPSALGLASYGNPANLTHWDVTESEIAVPWPAPGVIRNLKIILTSSTTATFTLRKNGADTGLTLAIVTASSGTATGVDVSVAAGDLISLHKNNSVAVLHCSIEFEGTNARESAYVTSSGQPIGATLYNGLIRGKLGYVGAEGLDSRNITGPPGSFVRLYVSLSVAPGSGKSWTFTIYKNGVAQNGSGGTPDTRLVVADSATTGNTSFALSVVEGDFVSLELAPSGSPATMNLSYGAAFRATTDGYSHYCGRSTSQLHHTNTVYNNPSAPGGTGGWSTTEADFESVGGITTFDLRGLTVAIDAQPGSGGDAASDAYTFTGRVNSATPGGAPTITLLNTESIDGTGAGAASMSVSSADTWSIECDPTTTPALVSANWVFWQFIATSVGARVSQLVALLVQDRDPDPAVTTPPTGGGTVPAGIDPDPGIDLCPVEVPIAFMDITPPGLSTRRYSAVPINVATADDPRVASFGSVTRALVRNGDIRGSSASAELIDTDRFLRGLESTDSLVNAVIEYYISSEAGIKARAVSPTLANLPRRVFSGLVTDAEPLPELKMRVQATDYLQALLDKVPLPTYPQRVFNVNDFPNLANDPKSTTSPGNPSLIGKPIPIGYGLLSDESLGLLARGVVPAFFVGKRLVDGFDWDEYVVFGHAPSPGGILGFFGDVTGGVSRDRFDTSFEGVDFLWPGHAGWTAAVGPALYRDFNGNRYTVVYARGPRSDSAREMRIPFSINIGGVEATGDGTGLLIDSLPLQILHLLVNFVLQNYTSGTYLAPPLVNGYSRVKTSSFSTVKTRSEVRTPNGWLGAFLLGWNGGTVTLRDIARLAYEHGLQLGTNKDGQIIGSTIDPAAASVRNVNDITDTIEKSFQARRQRNDIRTHFWKKYARRYVPALPEPTPVTGEALPNALRESHVDWEFEDTAPLIDATGDTKYGERKMDLLLELTRDTDTAEDLALLHSEVLAPGPVISRYREGLCGTNIDLGDNHELTHFEGITSSGWTDQLLRCEQHRLDLDRFEVEIESLDIADMAGSP